MHRKNKKNMSLSKFESEVKYIPQDVEIVYSRFADLRNFSSLKDRLSDPAIREKLQSQLPADKIEEAERQLQNVEFDEDSISLASPMGNIKLAIVERDVPKCIKFQSEGSPIPLYVWIQLLPHGEGECKMRVTIGAEVNFFMKGMVSKPLQQAADGLANILSTIR